MSSEDNVNSGQLNVSTGQSKDHINYDFLQVKSHHKDASPRILREKILSKYLTTLRKTSVSKFEPKT